MNAGAKDREEDRRQGQPDEAANLPPPLFISLRLHISLRLGIALALRSRAAHFTSVPGS